MKKNNFLYKKIIFNLGKFFDKFFFTNFYEKATNYYHQYHLNDYEFPKDKIAFIHTPKIGGLTIWNCLKTSNKIFKFERNSKHNPVSFSCSPKDYKYITFLRDPVDRVYSHYQMNLKINDISASRGLINFLKSFSEVRNLYCQYYSGLIDEVVDERIYNIALKNLKNFNTIIDFDNYSIDVNKFLKKFNIENNKEIHENKSSYNPISVNEIEVIKIYNYWDIRLYNEILNKKIPLE